MAPNEPIKPIMMAVSWDAARILNIIKGETGKRFTSWIVFWTNGVAYQTII